MLRARFLCLAIVCCGTTPTLTGCVALSLGIGGKTQQVVSDTPETKERIAKLESRVEALEQQLTVPPSLSGISGPTVTGPTVPETPGLVAPQ